MAIPLPPKLAKQALNALAKYGGNQSAAAASLGLDRGTFLGRVKTARASKMAAAHTFAKAALVNPDKMNQHIDRLQAQIERMSRAKKFKPVKIAKRSGKDDTVSVLMPDMHGKYYNPVAVSLFLGDMERLQPDYIYNLGDLVDCGGFLAAHHVIGYQAQMEYSYEDDIAVCNGVLDQIQKRCPNTKIEMIEGNHEDRVERWCIQQALGNGKDSKFMQRAFAPQYLLDLAGRGIPYYRRSEFYDGLSIPGAIRRGKTLIVHDPGTSDPRRTLAKFGCSVYHGHDHQSHANITSTVDRGDIGVFAFGCLSLKQQLYAHSRPTGHTNGYGIKLEARSGDFLTISVPLLGDRSCLGRMFR